MADAAMREVIGALPVPEFDVTAFTEPPPLHEATVAVVTSAGLMRPGEEPWPEGDSGFRVFGRDERDLIVGHQSTNFDRSGVAADLNVVYPLDRIKDMQAEGKIGAVASRHLSFTGPIMELSTLRIDTGPAAAKLLIDEGVDVVLLTPI